MSDIRNWTKIWYIERVFYKLWDRVALPRPVTQTFAIWFGISFLGIFRIFHLLWNIRLLDKFLSVVICFLMTRKQFQSLSSHISSHIFHHTHISWLAEKGYPLKAIMD